MTKEEFISWITDLGFCKTWDSESEYSIFPGEGVEIFGESAFAIANSSKYIFSEKLYFTVDDLDIRVYYSNFKNGMSYGSNLGHFPLADIGYLEKSIILTVLLKHFDEIPIGFKKYLRDEKIKNILED